MYAATFPSLDVWRLETRCDCWAYVVRNALWTRQTLHRLPSAPGGLPEAVVSPVDAGLVGQPVAGVLHGIYDPRLSHEQFRSASNVDGEAA